MSTSIPLFAELPAATKPAPDPAPYVARLGQIAANIEQLRREEAAVLSEARAAGLPTGGLRDIVTRAQESPLRRRRREERERAAAMIRERLGEFSSTPLGAALP